MAIRYPLWILLLLLLVPGFLSADEGNQTVGWFQRQLDTFGGYSFFAPGRSSTTYLVDGIGRVVHSWPSSFNPGNAAYLLPGGQILRAARIPGNMPLSAGGVGGRVERIAWDGTLLWEFEYSSDQVQHHHDVEQLPNGNVLLVAWELKTAAQALAAGRDPSLLSDNELWPDHIIEVEPTGSSGGTIVWQWHAWDHLIQEFDPTLDNFGVVADHPEKIHINFDGGSNDADWLHINSVDYNPNWIRSCSASRLSRKFGSSITAPPPQRPPAAPVETAARVVIFSIAGATPRPIRREPLLTRGFSSSTVPSGSLPDPRVRATSSSSITASTDREVMPPRAMRSSLRSMPMANISSRRLGPPSAPPIWSGPTWLPYLAISTVGSSVESSDYPMATPSCVRELTASSSR